MEYSEWVNIDKDIRRYRRLCINAALQGVVSYNTRGMRFECENEAKEGEKALRLGRGRRARRKSESRSTRHNDFGQVNIHSIQVLNKLGKPFPLLLAPLHRTH